MPLCNIGHNLWSDSLLFGIANKSFFILNYPDLPIITLTVHQALEQVMKCYSNIEINIADNAFEFFKLRSNITEKKYYEL